MSKKPSQPSEAPNKLIVKISAPNFRTANIKIRNIDGSPYVHNKFGKTALEKMRSNMVNPAKKKRGEAREPKNFEREYQESLRMSPEGWYGLPADGLRAALVDACAIVGAFKTVAKRSLFVQADGFDQDDNRPLVKLISGKPEKFECLVKNATGVADLRARGMFKEWSALLRIRYDADVFALEDVANLVMRVGQQIGIGAGRPYSENSVGMGWGLFEVCNE